MIDRPNESHNIAICRYCPPPQRLFPKTGTLFFSHKVCDWHAYILVKQNADLSERHRHELWLEMLP